MAVHSMYVFVFLYTPDRVRLVNYEDADDGPITKLRKNPAFKDLFA